MTPSEHHEPDYGLIWRIFWITVAAIFAVFCLAKAYGGQRDYQITGPGIGVASFRGVGWPLTNYDSGCHWAYKNPLIPGDTNIYLAPNSNLWQAVENSPSRKFWKKMTPWSTNAFFKTTNDGSWLVSCERDVR